MSYGGGRGLPLDLARGGISARLGSRDLTCRMTVRPGLEALWRFTFMTVQLAIEAVENLKLCDLRNLNKNIKRFSKTAVLTCVS